MARRDYGTGTITPRGPKVFQLRWMDPPDPVTGVRLRRTLTLNNVTRREAATRLGALTAGKHADTNAITLRQSIARWRHETKHEEATSRNYDLGERSIPDRVADLPLARVDVHVMRSAVDHVTSEHGPHRGRLAHAVMSGGLKYAWEHHWIADKVYDRVPRPPAPTKKSPVPTPAQIGALRAAVAEDPQYHAWLTLAPFTNARRQEVVALRWSSIDLETGDVFITEAVDPVARGAKIKNTKTGNSRKLAIAGQSIEALRAWHAAMTERAEAVGVTLGPDAFIFSDELDGSRPWRPDLATKRFAKIRKKHGVTGVTLRSMRHYGATYLLGAGYDAKNVAGRLGHTRVQTTEDIYAGTLPTRDRQMAEHVEALV